MEKKLFVSFSSKDDKLVGGLKQKLQDSGVVFLTSKKPSREQNDKLKSAGSRKVVVEQIKSADGVIIVASENSDASPRVNYEAALADALGKPILVVARKGSAKTKIASVLPKGRRLNIEDLHKYSLNVGDEKIDVKPIDDNPKTR